MNTDAVTSPDGRIQLRFPLLLLLAGPFLWKAILNGYDLR